MAVSSKANSPDQFSHNHEKDALPFATFSFWNHRGSRTLGRGNQNPYGLSFCNPFPHSLSPHHQTWWSFSSFTRPPMKPNEQPGHHIRGKRERLDRLSILVEATRPRSVWLSAFLCPTFQFLWTNWSVRADLLEGLVRSLLECLAGISPDIFRPRSTKNMACIYYIFVVTPFLSFLCFHRVRFFRAAASAGAAFSS